MIGGRSAASTPRLSSSSSSSSPGPESSDGRRRQAVSRRQSWQDGLTAVGLWSLALGLTPAVGRAADAVCLWHVLGRLCVASFERAHPPSTHITPPHTTSQAPAATGAGPRLWVSGKGAQPKGSKDRTGTKRDSSYLRCLSDCTTECRKPGQGPSKESNECLELCQAYCCQTYEQCTYLLQPE